MTDFERKPDKAKNDVGSQGDPLLELTRLLGGRPRIDPILAEGTAVEAQGEPSPQKWAPGLSMQPSGISMAGGLMLGYGVGGISEPQPASLATEQPSAQEPETDWQESFWEEEPIADPAMGQVTEAVWLPLDENNQQAGNWTEPEAVPVLTSPLSQGENDAAGDYVNEQIFQALAGDLTHSPSDALTGAFGDVSAPLPQSDQAQFNDAEIQPAPSSPPDFSGGYLFYGHAVPMNTQNPQPIEQSLPPSSARLPQQEPVAAVPQPQPAPTVRRSPSPAVVQQIQEPQQPLTDFSTVDLGNHFNEALQDFDLTIQEERRRRRTRPTSFSTQATRTDPFATPPLDYNSSPLHPAPTQVADDDFSGNFSQAHADSARSGANSQPFFAEANATQTPTHAINQEANIFDHSAYNWDSAHVSSQSPSSVATVKNKKRRVSVFLSLLLLGLLGGGAGIYTLYESGSDNPVFIKAGSSDIKNRPQEDSNQATNGSFAEIDSQAEGALATRQNILLDESETPLDLDKFGNIAHGDMAGLQDEASRSALDAQNLDPVAASIIQATERGIPLHIVPTVSIRRDEDGNLSEMQPLSDGEGETFIPGGDYRAQIADGRMQNENEQPSTTGETTTLNDNRGLPIPQDGLSEAEFEAAAANISNIGSTSDFESVESDIITAPAQIPQKPLNENMTSDPTAQTTVADGATSPVLDERFFVQISSQPSQEAAIESSNDMKNRFASLVGNNQIVIVPANINNRVYYRVRILVPERADAVSLCEKYQAAGGSCFIGN